MPAKAPVHRIILFIHLKFFSLHRVGLLRMSDLVRLPLPQDLPPLPLLPSCGGKWSRSGGAIRTMKPELISEIGEEAASCRMKGRFQESHVYAKNWIYRRHSYPPHLGWKRLYTMNIYIY